MDSKNESTTRVIRLDVSEINRTSIDYSSKLDNQLNYPKTENINNIINLRQVEINKMVSEISSLIKRK